MAKETRTEIAAQAAMFAEAGIPLVSDYQAYAVAEHILEGSSLQNASLLEDDGMLFVNMNVLRKMAVKKSKLGVDDDRVLVEGGALVGHKFEG